MISVQTIKMEHSGGSKDYDIYAVISKDTGLGVLITRWGKIGAVGQSKVEAGTDKWVQRLIGSTERKKEGRGYFQSFSDYQEVKERSGVADLLGHLWSKHLKELHDVLSPEGEESAAFAEPPAPVAPKEIKPVERPQNWGSW